MKAAASSVPAASLKSSWADVRGLRVHALVSKPPRAARLPRVVLVYGLGVSGRYMRPAARGLAPHAEVFAPDLPGFGHGPKQRPVKV